MPTKTSEREYRRCAEFRTLSDGECTVEGYATTFDKPYILVDTSDYAVYEVIDRNAFDSCDMSDVIMQYDHAGHVYARNKNGTLHISTDENGLKITAELGGTAAGRQLYEEIKGGYTDKMSFCFVVSDAKRESELRDGKTIVTRRITGIKKLYDVSAVSVPANDTTSISARGYCDGVIAELEAERLSALDIARRKLEIKLKMEA